MSSVECMNRPQDMERMIRQILANYPDRCNIQVSPGAKGWRFTSLKNYFESFVTTGPISCWEAGEGVFTYKGAKGAGVRFPDTIVRCQFDSGSILLIYRSGHIRWITGPGFLYYAFLTKGMTLAFTQGDLMLFPLPDEQMISHRQALADRVSVLPDPIWAKPYMPLELTRTGQWIETDEITVGGSRSHCARGQMKIVRPVENDHRTMQIITLAPVCIKHDPHDDIHPTLYLQPGQHYLITKLPGFSNPVREMNFPDGVLI